MPLRPEISIRAAVPGDAPALAALHLAVWQATYRDLAPPEAFDRLDLSWRLAQWQRWLARPAPFGALLALGPEGPAGLVSFGPNDTPVFGGRGEIEHLYVAQGARGAGLGRQLLTLARDQLAAAGLPGTGLAVVRGNHAARAFYVRTGGHEATGFTDPGPLWRSDNILITWD